MANSSFMSPRELSEEMEKYFHDPQTINSLTKFLSERRKKNLTGEVLKFKHHKTGEDLFYELSNGEELCEEVCRRDKTNLVYCVVSQVGGGYYCPNCQSVYESV